MAASYPGSVKSFSTKNTGDAIEVTHVTDLEQEVASLEAALLSIGLAHHLRTALTNSYDLGVLGATFRDLNLGRNALIGGTLGVTGALTGTTGTFSGLLTATGGQIAFPSTQVPSSDVNTLDDYEEGTWTPVIGGAGGTSGQTYGTRFGTYTKFGRVVVVNGGINLTTKGTITGNVQIQGLPFAAANTGVPAVITWTDLATATFAIVLAETIATSTALNVYGRAISADPHVNLATADLNNTSGFNISLVYQV